MPLEVFSFIPQLVATNPLGTDPKSQGDDHIRGVKATLQNQFPNFTGEAVTLTEAEINAGVSTDALAGYLNTGLHAEYAADFDDIAVNSTYFFTASSVTNAPPDFLGGQTGYVTTFNRTGQDKTQIVYGESASREYEIWERNEQVNVWNAWKLVAGRKIGGYIAGNGTNNWVSNCSVVRASTGTYDVTFTTPMVGTNYVPSGMAEANSYFLSFFGASIATTGCQIQVFQHTAAALADRDFWFSIVDLN